MGLAISGRYEIQGAVPGGGGRSYYARHRMLQHSVMVHFLPKGGVNQNLTLLEKVEKLGEGDRRLFIDGGEHDSVPFIVSWPLPDFDNLANWLDRALRETQSPESVVPVRNEPSPVEVQPQRSEAAATDEPAPAKEMGEFTRRFGSPAAKNEAGTSDQQPSKASRGPIEEPIYIAPVETQDSSEERFPDGGYGGSFFPEAERQAPLNPAATAHDHFMTGMPAVPAPEEGLNTPAVAVPAEAQVSYTEIIRGVPAGARAAGGFSASAPGIPSLPTPALPRPPALPVPPQLPTLPPQKPPAMRANLLWICLAGLGILGVLVVLFFALRTRPSGS